MVLTPTADLREMDCFLIQTESLEIFELLASPALKHVVLDFHRTDYFGSAALAFFLNLWKRVRAKGSMVFCDLSSHERDILLATNLDRLWPIYASRSQALSSLDS
jgi:anti-sigma B factor antagonist